jgi:hypothetical protein
MQEEESAPAVSRIPLHTIANISGPDNVVMPEQVSQFSVTRRQPVMQPASRVDHHGMKHVRVWCHRTREALMQDDEPQHHLPGLQPALFGQHRPEHVV